MNHARLNDLERKIIRLLCEGKTPKQIGPLVGFSSRRNVHNYLTKIKDKLGVETNWQACAVFALIHHAEPWAQQLLKGKASWEKLDVAK